MTLTTDEIHKFQRDGYLVIDSGLKPEVLDGIVADLAGKFVPQAQATDGLRLAYRDERRIQDAWSISRHVLDAALAENVRDALKQLYERSPFPFQTLNFRMGSEQKVHSDTIHFNSLPKGFMCGVWLALEDIDESNGPLVYYPGSQKLREVTLNDVGVRPHHFNYPKYEEYIEDLIEKGVESKLLESKLAPALGTITKGQALIWSSNLLHGGAPHRDKSRTRNSQVTHYFFEGCEYWQPMHSNDRFTFRIYPTRLDRQPIRVQRVKKIVNGLRWRAARVLGRV